MTPGDESKKGPSFVEFVRYILDNKEDEFWGTTYQFCSPCITNFTVIVKVRKDQGLNCTNNDKVP